VRFLPQTREKLELAITCNQEIADQYAALDTPEARKWRDHHEARVEACRDKLSRTTDEELDDE